jgi:hypothetical protein
MVELIAASEVAAIVRNLVLPPPFLSVATIIF